jgi:hypothetical protein
MNSKVILLGFVVVMFVSAIGVAAQSAQRYRADIPFSFNIGNREFAAGQYDIERFNPATSDSALVIRNAETGAAIIVPVNHSSSTSDIDSAKLIFRQYQNRYFLGQIATPTLEATFRFGRTEKALAKMTPAETTQVVLKRSK